MMTGKVQRQVVTSGRLTGSVKVSRMGPGPGDLPEPVYSLYSSDSEDRVTTLHKDLDRCAALLSDIVHVDKKVSPNPPRSVQVGATKSRQSTALGKKNMKKLPTKTGFPRTLKAGAAKSRPTTSQGKATTKKLPSKADDKSSPSAPQTHQSSGPETRSGAKVQPFQKLPLQLHSSAAQKQTRHLLNPLPPPPPRPQASIHQPGKLPASASGPLALHRTDHQSGFKAPQRHTEVESDGEVEFVPVKDTNMQRSATSSQTDLRRPHLHVETRTLNMSNLQLETGAEEKVPDDTCCTETDEKARTARYLLEELKTLITGRGSVAERLLNLLEQTVSSLQMSAGSSIVQTGSAPDPDMSSAGSQSSQFSRLARIRNEELREREEAANHQKREMLGNSEALGLQEELTSAQSRLQGLQDDLTELRKALQDAQSQLRDMEAENTLMKMDLEDTRGRLLESEREKSELVCLAERRLEEMGHLKRLFQIQCSSLSRDAVGNSASVTQQQPHKQDPAPHTSTDLISQYLRSLREAEPPHTEHVRTAAEREGNVPLHDRVTSQQSNKPAETSVRRSPDHNQSGLDGVRTCGPKVSGPWFNSMSQCDVESVSNWSMRSGSTFNTRDEVAFQDGLAALDASIASLQKTIQLDLRK